jgi:predicted Fe-S protein YdhL (DUF1289 family)
MKLIPNPCKSICKQKDGVCTGCHRTSDEVRTWSKMNNEQKQLIIHRIAGKSQAKD